MMIIKTDDFLRALKKLPKEIQLIYHRQEGCFKENWRDPRPHIKKIRSLQHAFSFRVTRRYRVFFYF